MNTKETKTEEQGIAFNRPVICSCHRLKVAEKHDIYAPFYVRWAARIVCWWMNKANAQSYQVYGKVNWANDDGTADINANWDDIFHWVLRCCGYSCCSDDVKKVYRCEGNCK